MSKRLVYNCSTRNLYLGIMTIYATIIFMMQIYSALLTIKGEGTLTNIQYTIFELKISVTRESYSPVYSIYNYPLIPILVGIVYNIYCTVKNYCIKDKINS